MSSLRSHVAGSLMLAAVVAGCSDAGDAVAPRAQRPGVDAPLRTASFNTTSTLLARARFDDPLEPNFKVKRMTDDWHVEIKAKPAFDLAVQSILFPAGSHSGWHRHPGPVFIQVAKGTMTFYESDDPTCTPIVREEGEGFLDVGDHAHIARNESGEPATNVVTYFAPPGASLRIDAERPGNCPF